MIARAFAFSLVVAAVVAAPLAPAVAGGAPTIRLRDGRTFTQVGRPLGGGRHLVRVVRGDDGVHYIAKTRDKRLPKARSEADVLARLGDHGVEGVPRVIAFAYDEPSWNDATLVMTMAPGRSLAQWFDDARRPSARQMARVVAAAARVVHQAHGTPSGGFPPRGIAHIDLKPGNIMVVDPAAEKPEVEVIDWETAAEIDSHWLGGEFTDAYAAPEMWTGASRTARTDVYSLGATLQHMASGILPGTARGLGRARRVPPGLAAIIAKATAPDPRDRYRDAAALARALDAWAVTAD